MMPFDMTPNRTNTETPEKPQTFWERFKTRRYVGRYNGFMRGGSYSCMSSRRENIRFTPLEEERFTRAVLQNIYSPKAPDEWDFTSSHTAKHMPTQTEFWMSNGTSHFEVYRPQRIPLRTGSQRKLYCALCQLREHMHRQRHRVVSEEAKEFIGKFEERARALLNEGA